MGQAATETFGAWLIAQGEAGREDAVGSVGRFWKGLPDRAKIRSVAGVMKLLGEHPDWPRIRPALDAAVHEFRTRGARPLAAAEGPPGRSPFDEPGPDAMRSPFGPVQAGVVQVPEPGEGQPVPQPGWRDGGPVVPVVPAGEAVRAAQERAAQWRDPQQPELPFPPFPPGTGPSPQTLPYPEPVMRFPETPPEPPVNPAAEARREAMMGSITPEEVAAARRTAGIPDDPGMLAELRAASAIDAHLGVPPGTLAVWNGEGWEPVGFVALADGGDRRGPERAQERLEEAFADSDARMALAAAQRRQDGYLEHAGGPPPHHDFAALWHGADFGPGL